MSAGTFLMRGGRRSCINAVVNIYAIGFTGVMNGTDWSCLWRRSPRSLTAAALEIRDVGMSL